MTSDTLPKEHFQSLDELEGHYWWHQNRLLIARELLLQTRHLPASFLDVGCGTGGFARALAQQLRIAGPVMGLDASPTALACAQLKGLQAVHQDLMAPFAMPQQSFDLITAMDVLEHLPDETCLLQSVSMTLKPKGWFLASVPAHPSLFTSWDHQLGHHRRYVCADLKIKIRAAGLNIRRCTYAFSYILFPAFIRRYLGHSYQAENCIFPPVSPLANKILLLAGKLEAQWIRHFPAPFGLSIFVLAQKS